MKLILTTNQSVTPGIRNSILSCHLGFVSLALGQPACLRSFWLQSPCKIENYYNNNRYNEITNVYLGQTCAKDKLLLSRQNLRNSCQCLFLMGHLAIANLFSKFFRQNFLIKCKSALKLKCSNMWSFRTDPDEGQNPDFINKNKMTKSHTKIWVGFFV